MTVIVALPSATGVMVSIVSAVSALDELLTVALVVSDEVAV